jgi:hypothetical protein
MNVRAHILDRYRVALVTPGEFGVSDCLCFAAECAQPIVGRDPIAHLRGRYDSETSARRLMVENGWRDMGDVAASIFPEIAVAQAQAGDWAHVVDAEGNDAVGVVVGAIVAVKLREGATQLPLLSARRAFRVAR